jgi:hypothetical protein
VRGSWAALADGALVLSLGDACIQTTARRAHRELGAALLAAETAETAAAASLDTLTRFLSTTDFPSLRAAHPELAGGTRCRVRLARAADGGVRWEVIEPDEHT